MSVNDVPGSPRPTAGLDWASTDHAVAVVGPDGAELDRFGITHSRAGLATLCRRLSKAGVTDVAIERGDGPVVETLRDGGFAVFVIHPTQLKNLRSRYGSAGRKDDHFDAYVLGDVLRTDRRRLRPLERDTEATITLRATCRARKDLVGHRVALTNQLRAHLQICFPGAVGLFAELDSAISLAFLRRFTDQTRADWLSVKRLAAWLSAQGYCGRTQPAVLHERLTRAPRGLTGPDGEARAAVTTALLDAIEAISTQIAALADRIEEQLDLHPDRDIFTSLPRAGTVRAARLLAEIGDARGRFNTPEALTALAGVVPTTRQSGKLSLIHI